MNDRRTGIRRPDEDPMGRLSRRRLAQRAAALGLTAPALGAALAASHRVDARQQGTPPGLGEPAATPPGSLDLANLSPGIPDPTEPVTIGFASWVAGGSETMAAMRDQFQTLHPTITVDFEDIPAEEMTNQLTTRVAAGNPPDVAYVDASAVVDFASRNALVELGPYVEQSAAVQVDDYVEAFLVSAMWEGMLYGLPFDGESTGLFYRTDMFETAGIAGPPTSWEEFEAAAQALTNTEGEQKTYGFIIFAPEAAYYWYPWLWQNGGDLLSPDGQEVLFNSAEGKEAAEFYVGLAEYSPPDFFNSNSYDGRVAFATGQVGMYVAGAWFAGVLQSEFPDITGTWTAAALPTRTRCATTIAGDILVLPAGGQNHDAAWKWAEFLSAPQNLLLWATGTPEAPSTLLPTRKSLLEDPALFERNPILEGFAQQMECGVTNFAPNPRFGEIEAALNDALGRAIYGEIDASTALDEAALEAEEIIAEG